MKTQQPLDLRGLEPPQPMLRILEALAALAPDAELVSHLDREPIHLLPLLAERGLETRGELQPDHSYVLHITHPA